MKKQLSILPLLYLFCGFNFQLHSQTPVLTWETGSDVIGQQGLLITSPGSRYSSSSWTDASGNLWLFGGIAYDKNGVLGRTNDLWRYDPTAGEWTWMAGSDTIKQAGVYGTKGTGSTTNIPGARADPTTWTDGSGNFWLFGGSGYDKNGANGLLNDLWKYAPATGEWTWMAGSDVKYQYGNYGTKGIGSTVNIPGARYRSISWVDNSGNFWLFGGQGFAKSGFTGDLNDLWQYDPATKEWTWMAGSDVISQPSIYGTKGTGNTTNIPGARHYAVSWSDGTGNFWLFGGSGKDKNDLDGILNDLWRYEPTNGKWTWMAGSDVVNQAGAYGVQGTGSITNIPGARVGSSSWSDISGNFWLFGGGGYDKDGTMGGLNDMWKYNPTTGEWTWIGGGDIINQPGSSGTKGSSSPANIPGARNSFIFWSDALGNHWLFGGYGYDLMGSFGILNDLWRHDPATGEWTWVTGSDTRDRPGVYGTKGIGSSGNNTPGARAGSISWTDSPGNLWLFGGGGYDIMGSGGILNDLWRYNITTCEWTLMGGSAVSNQSGIYGTKGIGNKGNIPGARIGSISWTDGSGNFWLFGGSGYDKAGSNGMLNDLWKFKPTTRKWTWMAGSDVINQQGAYGIKGSGSTTNFPGARQGSVSWTDGSGNLFFFGGFGYDAGSGTYGRYNDLWRYNPVSKQWTWLAGNNVINQPGNYGTKGIGSAANTPGARWRSISWTDGSGKLWLFGGEGYTTNGIRYFNDLWQYEPASGEWTWVAGSELGDESGIYGTKGIGSTTNIPGGRNGPISWIDTSGNLWLFGGEAIDINDVDSYINDLWKYGPLTGEWTWVAGSDTNEQSGIYGTMGTGSTTNIPGARNSTISWNDSSGNLWLFGGNGIDKSGSWNDLNDLWKIEFIPGVLDTLLLYMVNQNQIAIKWTDDPWADDYIVDVSDDNFSTISQQLVVTDTFAIISSLNPGVQYSFRLTTTNNLGSSPYSDTLVVLTKPETPVLNTVATTDINQTRVAISWPAVTGIVDDYQVEVSSTDFATPTLLTGYPLTVTGTTLNIGIDVGTSPLIPGANYWIRARSRNITGESPNSNVEAIITIPADPVATAAASITSTSFQANWEQVTGAGYYILEVSSDDFTSLALRDSIIGQLIANVTALAPITEYKYRVRAGNVSGLSGYANIIIVTTPFTEEDNPVIPFERFGGTDESWNLFSIPYELDNNSVSTIFADYDPARHEFDWRIVRYRSNKNDYVNFNTGQVSVGEAYWFNAKENITVKLGSGKVTSQIPFTKALTQGWNLIGNPYPVNISWEQVILDNPTIAGVESLQIFSGRAQSAGDIMAPFSGGFVWSDQATSVVIDPFSASSGGRISSNNQKIESTDIDGPEWLLDISLETDATATRLGGFGMHPEASELKDQYDAMAVPRFMVYTELFTAHDDYFYPWFATDVVPTATDHTWAFTLASNEAHALTRLTWDQAALQGKEAGLYLLDKSSGSLVDMTQQGTHVVDMSHGEFKFDIYYLTGGELLLPNDLILGTAYPNPANTLTTIPVVLPAGFGVRKINLSIYDFNGKHVTTLAEGNYAPGVHEFTWDLSEDSRQRISGMFIYRLLISDGSIAPMQKKLLVR